MGLTYTKEEIESAVDLLKDDLRKRDDVSQIESGWSIFLTVQTDGNVSLFIHVRGKDTNGVKRVFSRYL